MDDASKIDQLTTYGQELGEMVLNDEVDTYVIRPAEQPGE